MKAPRASMLPRIVQRGLDQTSFFISVISCQVRKRSFVLDAWNTKLRNSILVKDSFIVLLSRLIVDPTTMKKLIEIAILIAIFSLSTTANAQNNEQSKPQPKKQTTSSHNSSQGSSSQQPTITVDASTDLSGANAEIEAGMEKMRADSNPFR